jgi:aspartyl protease family protein
MAASGHVTFAFLVVLGAVLLAPNLDRTATPSTAAPGSPPITAAAAAPGAAWGDVGTSTQELRRAADSHFYANASVNGAPIRFVVDTGASAVVLTRADAARAGIRAGQERVSGMGVGGVVMLAPVTVDQLTIGTLTARNVDAMIADDLPISLLGQSFLEQVASVEIRGDRMTLR